MQSRGELLVHMALRKAIQSTPKMQVENGPSARQQRVRAQHSPSNSQENSLSGYSQRVSLSSTGRERSFPRVQGTGRRILNERRIFQIDSNAGSTRGVQSGREQNSDLRFISRKRGISPERNADEEHDISPFPHSHQMGKVMRINRIIEEPRIPQVAPPEVLLSPLGELPGRDEVGHKEGDYIQQWVNSLPNEYEPGNASLSPSWNASAQHVQIDSVSCQARQYINPAPLQRKCPQFKTITFQESPMPEQGAAIDLLQIPEKETDNSDHNQRQHMTHLANFQTGFKRRRVWDRNERRRSKHILLPQCGCTKTCGGKFLPETRREIHKTFWAGNFAARRRFLDSNISSEKCKRLSISATQPRQFTMHYFLPNEEGIREPVCKRMFLHTLGMKSDGMITRYRQAKDSCDVNRIYSDRRGGTHRKKTATNDTINQHIMRYNPTKSHYTLKHAPHRKYLDRSLTIKSMWSDLRKSGFDVSYSQYQKVFHQKKISFGRPRPDLCEKCEEGRQHLRDVPLVHGECLQCSELASHKANVAIARQAYINCLSGPIMLNVGIFAVDLQRVILLPIMTAKSCFFTPRLQTYNETFAAMSKGTDTCVVWHEGITGRNAPDISSAFATFMLQNNEEFDHFLFWADNCTAQNKNWILFSTFLMLVHTPGGPQSITIQYLERGHTFMRADSIHGLISQQMRRESELFTMEDFIRVITHCKGNIGAIELHPADIRDWPPIRTIRAPFPKLNKIRSVKFLSGDLRMHYKLRLDSNHFSTCCFISGDTLPPPPLSATHLKGVDPVKIGEICSKLVPMMPQSKREFWNALKQIENN